jgi:hypothetical protein
MFSPLDKYGGYSYKDVMVDPLAEAMRDALAITAAEGTLVSPPDKQRPTVYMGLQGALACVLGVAGFVGCGVSGRVKAGRV